MKEELKSWKAPLAQTTLDILCQDINRWAREKGFYDEERNEGEMVALMHSELSEALEAMRHGNPKDEHCPEFGNLEIEMADCVIRIMDYFGHKQFSLGDCIAAKMEYNMTRPRKHGKAF